MTTRDASGRAAYLYERISDMAVLRKGWDSYRADPPSAEVLEKSREFAGAVCGNGAVSRCLRDLNPSVVGGTGFTFMNESGPAKELRVVYVEFCNTGSVLALFQKRGHVAVRRITSDFSVLTSVIELFLIY